MKKLKIGDKVQWESQSGGFSKVKTGVVKEIVPAGYDVEDCLPRGFTIRTDGMARPHTSYLIQVGGSIRLYWPVVKRLQRV